MAWTDAPRGREAVRGAAGRATLALFLTMYLLCWPYTLAFSPSGVTVEKSSAYAVPAAVPVAAAVFEAVAAEIGITSTELAVTIGLTTAAATGYAAFELSDGDTVSYAMGGLPHAASTVNWPSWGDLTDEQKSDWGSEENYDAAQWNQQLGENFGLAYVDQMTEWVQNGGSGEPPQPSDDDKSKMEKIKNATGYLAAGGIIAATAVYDLYNDISNIFVNNDREGMGVLWSQLKEVNGHNVQVTYADFGAWTLGGRTYYYGPNQWLIMKVNDSGTISAGTGTTSADGNPSGMQGRFFYSADLYPRYSQNYAVSGAGWTVGTNTGGRVSNVYTAVGGTYPGIGSGGSCYLNATKEYLIEGVYASTGSTVKTDYGQLTETPSELEEAVTDQEELNTYWSNVNENLTDEQRMGVKMPSDGISSETKYRDIVAPDDVTNIRDINEPYVEPVIDPGKQPVQDPVENPTEFQVKVREKVDELADVTMQGLFPFCLIYDANRFFTIIDNRLARSAPGWNLWRLDIPLDEFGVDGMDRLRLDLGPLGDFAGLVRPFTPLAVLGLLIGATYGFFLKRGGE